MSHSLCIYLPEKERFHARLLKLLAKKYKIKSTGEIVRLFIKKALEDNGFLDEKGRSTVDGIGQETPEFRGKRKLYKKTSLALE